MSDKRVKTISEIEAGLADAIGKWPGGIASIFKTVYGQVVGNASSFDVMGEHFVEPWFVPKNIRTVTSTSLVRTRTMMMQAEVHLQCASHLVKFMMEKGILDVGALPARKGPTPEVRVAASWTTMVCNHEIATFALLRNHGPTITHNTGITLSNRYYTTENSADPFMKHEAKIMTGLGMWKIVEPSDAKREYQCFEGPYLLEYMKTVYWPAVDWAMKAVNAALANAVVIP
ncbi:hypothetical protein ABIE89_002129 [Bradyrhizobium niftali]|uniref:hypothetical protein n=1 Tax=Bradyrhizobium niftali TaxID=2560055 RepID=UPI003832CABF